MATEALKCRRRVRDQDLVHAAFDEDIGLREDADIADSYTDRFSERVPNSFGRTVRLVLNLRVSRGFNACLRTACWPANAATSAAT